MQYAAFDIETTGLDPHNDRIIELALAAKGIIYSWLINPGIPIEPAITQITGITQEMIDSEGVPFATAWEEFSVVSCGYEKFIGHNAFRFDLPFLQSECLRAGYPKPFIDIIDTAALFKGLAMGVQPKAPHDEWARYVLDVRMYGLKYNLGFAASELGLTLPDGLHRAGADAHLTLDVYEALMQKNPGLEEILYA